jgi:hypothetical protein
MRSLIAKQGTTMQLGMIGLGHVEKADGAL